MIEVRRTLSVKEVVNLTKQEIWTYGTSGELIRIKNDTNWILDPDTYYIVSAEERNNFINSGVDKSHLVEARYVGRSREDTPVYHLISSVGKIVPITEQICAVMDKKPGFLIQPA